MTRDVLLWVLALALTAATAVYQRATGPTYPKRVTVPVGGAEYRLALPRSHGGPSDARVVLEIPDASVSGTIHFRRYPSADAWSTEELRREGDVLAGRLPSQPPAGKIEYHLTLAAPGETVSIHREEPVRIRFKGVVPAAVLIPHVAVMFAAMLLSNLTGLLVFARDARYRRYTAATFFLLLAGGMILGPVMQYYAFGELWTGVPFGQDLTDNKTLIAFLAWGAALIANRRKARPYLSLAACALTLVIFLIPHSMFGSELDPTTGRIKTG